MGIGDVVAAQRHPVRALQPRAPRGPRRGARRRRPGSVADRGLRPALRRSRCRRASPTRAASATPATDTPVAPVEVYPVTDPTPIVRGESTDHALMVSGDGEGLVDAADVGLLDGAGVIRYSAFVPDGRVAAPRDRRRRRARRDRRQPAAGAALDDGDARPSASPSRRARPTSRSTTDPTDARLDVFPGEQPSALTTTDQVGVRRVVGDRVRQHEHVLARGPRRPARSTATRGTAWRTQGFGDARGQRIEIELKQPITTDHVNLVQPLGGHAEPLHHRRRAHLRRRQAGRVALGPTLAHRGRADDHVPEPARSTRSRSRSSRRTTTGRTSSAQDDAVGFAEIRLRDAHVDARRARRRSRADAERPARRARRLVDRASAGARHEPRRDPAGAAAHAARARRSRARSTLPAARTFALTGNATRQPRRARRRDRTRAAARCRRCRAHAVGERVPARLPRVPGRCRARRRPPAPRGRRRSTRSRASGRRSVRAAPVTLDHLDLSVIADGRHSVPTHAPAHGRRQERARSRCRRSPISRPRTRPRPCTSRSRPCAGARSGSRSTASAPSRRSSTGPGAHGSSRSGSRSSGCPVSRCSRLATGRVDSGCRSDLVTIDGHAVAVRVTGPASRGAIRPPGSRSPRADPIPTSRWPRARTCSRPCRARSPASRSTAWCSRRGPPATAVDVASGRVQVAGPAPAAGQGDGGAQRRHEDARARRRARRSRSGSCSASRRARAGTREWSVATTSARRNSSTATRTAGS